MRRHVRQRGTHVRGVAWGRADFKASFLGGEGWVRWGLRGPVEESVGMGGAGAMAGAGGEEEKGRGGLRGFCCGWVLMAGLSFAVPVVDWEMRWVGRWCYLLVI